MAPTGRALAWLNLAWRFGHHVVVRMPRRALRAGNDLQRFRDAVEPEGYVPLTADERALLPSTMACIDCGLCVPACPELQAGGGTAWDEAWTFIAGPSRSIDRAVLVAAAIPPCTACDACTAACPMDIPIPQLAALVQRLARTRTGGS
ncbi:MAG TPA: 4Fe-4S dicluster domain-containing protein [Longimicrobiales bacterium]|nr:4Fe-4S dicluster domain-containing protein [Longimicrobiales bacterium]